MSGAIEGHIVPALSDLAWARHVSNNDTMFRYGWQTTVCPVVVLPV